jgi:hypothetical protein
MPVWNAEAFLSSALESLAAQTFRDFEVVAIDDGSSDGSRELLRSAAVRWKWLRMYSQLNGGIAFALNKAIAMSRGEILARMDADDVSLPERIEKQVCYLDHHTDVGVCGTAMQIFGGKRRRVVKCAVTDSEIRARMIFGCPMVHPSVVMQREIVISEPGPYSGSVEDYDLWLRLARRTRFANLTEPLLKYREHPAQYTKRPSVLHRESVWALQSRLLTSLHVGDGELDADAHVACGLVNPAVLAVNLGRVERWLVHIRNRIAKTGWTDCDAWYRECAEAWWRVARRQSLEKGTLMQYLRSPLLAYSPRLLLRASFLAICAIAKRERA